MIITILRLYLIRHGQAEGAGGRAVGSLDLPLSAAGAAAVRRLAASWSGAPPDAVWASDLRRAAETAALLAAPWGLPVASDPRLRELDFGEWEGAAWDDLHRRDGVRLDAWARSFWSDPPPGGESYPALAARAGAWLDDLLAAAAGRPAANVVAVAHGGSIRALVARALDLPRKKLFHLRVDPASVTVLAAGPRGLELLCLNAERFPAPGS